MPGKRVQIDAESWAALDLLARDRMMTFQELADEAFADLLKKHGRPVDLRAALRKSAGASADVIPLKRDNSKPRPPPSKTTRMTASIIRPCAARAGGRLVWRELLLPSCPRSATASRAGHRFACGLSWQTWPDVPTVHLPL